jgi:hypothetical protein
MRSNLTSMRLGRTAAALTGLLLTGLLVTTGCLIVASGAQAADPPDATAGLRVRIKLDVQGELLAPVGPDAPPLREPVEMAARFDFDETSPTPSSGETATPPVAVVRRSYRDATATMRVGDTSTTATLAADARRPAAMTARGQRRRRRRIRPARRTLRRAGTGGGAQGWSNRAEARGRASRLDDSAKCAPRRFGDSAIR